MGDEAGDYARRTERIKNLLSSYYGAAEQGQASPLAADSSAPPEPSATGGIARKQLGTATLDSATFDAERHIAQMTKSYTVERLLAEHRGMAREIKNLDSDMQQLVYENYNKFIAATDTIRAMKTNVDGMESGMDQLKTNMGASQLLVGAGSVGHLGTITLHQVPCHGNTYLVHTWKIMILHVVYRCCG